MTAASTILFGLGGLLALASLLGALAKRFQQPAILGELCAGILLGPTVLGHLTPRVDVASFSASGFFHGFNTLAAVLLLLYAGTEVGLTRVFRLRTVALAVSAAGIVIPFCIGLGVAVASPGLLGSSPGIPPTVTALFFATAMSISALPVIAKTLLDLELHDTDVGTVTLAAAIFDDLAGWIIFAIVLSLAGRTGASDHKSVLSTVVLTIGFACFMLTLGRRLIDALLPSIGAVEMETSQRPDRPMRRTTDKVSSNRLLVACLLIALLSAGITELIGVHALFGAFMAGIALGNSRHMRDETRVVLQRFVLAFFAPVFMAGIGLRVDFIAHFDPLLVVVVLGVACVGKIFGCTIAAKLTGMPPRSAWAVGFAMNARGAMEIILGLLALQSGLITEELFVALVVTALVTSAMTGPVLKRLSNPANQLART